MTFETFEEPEDPDLCEFCGEPEEVIIEDIGCCRKCEWKAKRVVWNRRYSYRTSPMYQHYGCLRCTDFDVVCTHWMLSKEEKMFEEPYPFMLDGKPLKIGDKIEGYDVTLEGRKWYEAKVITLKLRKYDWRMSLKTDNSEGIFDLDPCFARWPEIKKRWAYISTKNPEDVLGILFTEPMTELEAVKRYGQSVRAIPEEE